MAALSWIMAARCNLFLDGLEIIATASVLSISRMNTSELHSKASATPSMHASSSAASALSHVNRWRHEVKMM